MLPLALLALALAQPPADPAPTATSVLTSEPAVAAPPGGSLDFVLGLPTQIRYQHPVLPGLRVEAGASFWLIVLDVFAGVRFDLPLYHDPKRLLAIRPGVDARCLIGNSVWPLLSADVDLVYQRAWSGGTVTDFGLKLGAVYTFVQPNPRSWFNIPPMLPIAGVFFGLRF